MKLFITGMSRSFGIGKDSGKPYEILVCYTQQPIETGTFGGMTVEGFGSRQVEMRLVDAAVIRQFDGFKGPGTYDVSVETTLSRGEYRSALAGVLPTAKAA